MGKGQPRDWAHDLALPVLLFAALGGMTWAVRGSSGYGAANGCIFAGVTWGAAWWFISREPSGLQSRRYTSGWIVLALAFGIGFSGGRGWMQWPSFFEGHLQLDASKGIFAPISPVYGFVWLFIAGVPWAGIGACMLAWCGSERRLRAVDWFLRIACGLAGAAIARLLFEHFPEFFMPLYNNLHAQYQDFQANPNLRRLANDNRLAIVHLGIYLGFLAYEIGRRDWKNVQLILTVGLLNGAGWALCQNWKWAQNFWPNSHFNWWRCWESSGGISIGIAYGVAYFLVNRRVSEAQRMRLGSLLLSECPNLERFGLCLGLVFGLGMSVKCGLKGWANIYIGNEDYWASVLSIVLFPAMILGLAAMGYWIATHPLPRGCPGNVFPADCKIIWLVLIVQNILAQLVTGPYTRWEEMAFKIYYVLLFLTTAVIVHHYHCLRKAGMPLCSASRPTG
ncbi:MAG TPA: hypothetical protein P5318_15405 [Candidatus Hydrogenedentes bacterium]|nr:hypothetical protein [Candidatus Hydrogenedentota bacterium]HRT21501.1 hypothetical protein [Candidatus Hydrogenedentota bacterium]HRT66205.1 hypothetical protein [Candidatus Hydrogenedentota bacterium]